MGINCKEGDTKCNSYKSGVDASVLSDFMQGTFRALHVCTPRNINIFEGDKKMSYQLSDMIGVTDILNSQYNGVLLGQLTDKVECKQAIYNDEVWTYQTFILLYFRGLVFISYSLQIRNKMFKKKTKENNDMGTDLFSIDVHRGREHGLSPYIKYYTECTNKKVRNWNDLQKDFTPENLEMLSKIYESVADMDLLTGTMMENRDHRLTGVVARCVMGQQFYRTKFGDRYFYSFEKSPSAFTAAQIRAIESMRMSAVICENTDLPQIPANSFIVNSKQNPLVDCNRSVKFDYKPWKAWNDWHPAHFNIKIKHEIFVFYSKEEFVSFYHMAHWYAKTLISICCGSTSCDGSKDATGRSMLIAISIHSITTTTKQWIVIGANQCHKINDNDHAPMQDNQFAWYSNQSI